MSRGNRYSEAQLNWVRNNIKNCSSIKELHELSMSQLKWNVTLSQFKSLLKNNKIPTGYKRTKSDTSVFWNTERLKWLRKNAKGHSRKEITEMWNKDHPDTPLKESQIISGMKNHKIGNGRDCRFQKGQPCRNPIPKGSHVSRATEFKKGNVPHNTKKIGAITKRTDKRTNITYLWVKTGENRWEMLHRHIWKEKNGRVPAGYVVTFKDGNQLNCVPENLALISQEENLAIMQTGFKERTVEEFETIKLIANISMKTRELTRKAS